MRALHLVGSLALVLLVAVPGGASAQATLRTGLGGTRGWGENCIGMNDDGSSNPIDVTPAFASGLRFFTMTHTSLAVNTNGNITFSGPLPTYTPDAFPVAARPMIAPFWADVDTRTGGGGIFGICDGPGDGEAVIGPACDNPAQNGIWWDVTPGEMIFTWDRVGYYQCHHAAGQRMSFQLILTAAEGCAGAGDFDVEFRFNLCQWETGDASGGSGGFGGTPAQSGFDAGDGTNFVEIAMSRTAGIASRLCTMSNVGDPGVWRFQIRSGAVICPDAGMPCTVAGAMGACAMGRTNCVGGGTECVQQVMPSDERCDNLDNDCDGETDEMDADPLCGPFEICQAGACVEGCFEGTCPMGYTCSPEGQCVDPSCIGVTCVMGERCVDGTCHPACDGVVCPHGQSCISGRCVDGCAGIGCDDCTVCEEGTCTARCDLGGTCPGGETCDMATGHCVDSACVGVSCTGGYCMGGTCVDGCTGVTCPFGETCTGGACVPAERPDAAVERVDANFPGNVDSGITLSDSGTSGGMDGGVVADTGPRRTPRTAGACGCRVVGAHEGRPSGAFGVLMIVLAGVQLVRTRRKR